MARLFYAKRYYAAGTLCFGCIMFFVRSRGWIWHGDPLDPICSFVLLYFCSFSTIVLWESGLSDPLLFCWVAFDPFIGRLAR